MSYGCKDLCKGFAANELDVILGKELLCSDVMKSTLYALYSYSLHGIRVICYAKTLLSVFGAGFVMLSWVGLCATLWLYTSTPLYFWVKK